MENFDFILKTNLRSGNTYQTRWVLKHVVNDKKFNVADLVFIHRNMVNPSVSGEDWGNGPGYWNIEKARKECRVEYPDADEYETFSVSNSNPWQPSTEGCIAVYHIHAKIKELIEKELGMSSKEINEIHDKNYSALEVPWIK